MRRIVVLGLAVCFLFPGAAARGQERVSTGERLAAAARAQVGKTVVYDPAYVRLDYPGGDVPLDRGVCTDVVIRAYRALGVDLQKEIHEDMKKSFRSYPQQWGLAGPDANIDHRRVPNLQTFFRRHGAELPVTGVAGDYHAGDVVTWQLAGGLAHTGVVAVEKDRASRRPLIIHNIGMGAREEDFLFQCPITGHYRYLPTGTGGSGEARPFID